MTKVLGIDEAGRVFNVGQCFNSKKRVKEEYVMKGQCDVEHRITVACAQCGDLLECDGSTDTVDVEPCERCLQVSYDEGYKEGKEEE